MRCSPCVRPPQSFTGRRPHTYLGGGDNRHAARDLRFISIGLVFMEAEEVAITERDEYRRDDEC
jgi:hypothetical protein